MNTADLFYANPTAAYFFLLVPIMLLFCYLLDRHRQRIIELFGGRDNVEKIMYKRPRFNFWRKAFLIINAWILATLALMDPKGNARYPESFEKDSDEGQQSSTYVRKRKAHEVIFLLDTSASMDVEDMRGKRSRLEVAKDLIDETIRQLDGETVSLYTFTSESDKLVPSTMDYIYTRLILREVNINEEGVGGTDIYGAVESVLGDYPSKPDEKLKTIILFSDGEDVEYEDDTETQKKEFEEQFIKLIGDPSDKNIRFVTVGLGTEKGGEIPEILFEGKTVESHLDPTLLKILSDKGRGEYYGANNHDIISLSKYLSEQIQLDPKYLRQYEVEAQAYLDQSGEYFIYDSHYKRPILIAIIILGLVAVFPENWRRHK